MNRSHKASLLLAALLAGIAFVALGQAQTSTQGKPAGATKEKTVFKEDELASLLAPIALYPDQVIAQILVAATYPLEVVQANRWLQKNTQLKGEALANEAKKQPWDASVQYLTAVPDVLKMMDEKVDWTQKVGDAVLAQQQDVMNTIQKLRKQAKDSGNLKSDEKMSVKTEPAVQPAPGAPTTSTVAPPPEVIIIESPNPQVIYVPTYTTAVYGSWAYPSYPPYYWPPPVGYPGSGFWWGVGVGISIGVWGGAWGHCYPSWGHSTINVGEINIDRGGHGAQPKGGQNWQHDPAHRQGVSYRDSASQAKYDKGSRGNTAQTRDSYRGRGDSGAGGPSASTRDAGAGSGRGGTGSGGRDLGSPSAGTREAGGSGSRGSTSSGGRDIGSASSSSRSGGGSGGYSGSRGGSSGGSSFSGMNSGSRASSYSSRGGMSRGGGGGRRR